LFLVSVEAADTGVLEYWRRGDTVKSRFVEYRPFALVPQPTRGSFLADWRGEILDGEGFNRLITFDTWRNFYEARKLLPGRDAAIAHASPAKNYLMLQQYRMFEGAKFNDVVRLVIDIETTGLDPQSDELLMLAYVSNRGQKGAFIGSEKDILANFVRLVEDVDPDVLEGHNSIGFDFPFLSTRASINGVKLRIGRNGSEMRIGRERSMRIGPNERSFAPVYVHGRHIIDTYIGVQRYDAPMQKLSSYGLKEVAKAYGIAAEGRIILDREQMWELFTTDPERVKVYAIQDVEETLRLSEIVMASEFFQTQLIPDGYQGVATTGNGEKVNSLMVAEYLKRGKAIPFKQEAQSYIGGYVEVRETGVIGPIVKADVESLYPSLMLTRNIHPANDTENVMLPMLAALKEKRLEAKRLAQSSDKAEADFYEGLNQSYKTLINSFYGYLGGPFNFNDFAAAMSVTMGGRELVKAVADAISAKGGRVIEIDTDGVMFVPPVGIDTEDEEFAFVALVGKEALPAGIKLAHDGRYAKMLSLKMKNYVMLGYEGKMQMKGASLKNRGIEPMFSEFLKSSLALLFTEKFDIVVRLYDNLLTMLVRGEIHAESLSRRERVTEATKRSAQKRRLREITEAAKIGDYVWVYEKDDKTLAHISEFAGDYDVLYYAKKLHSVASRLESLFPRFAEQFAKPGVRWLKVFRTFLDSEKEEDKIAVN
jgi:DNA polymerase I